MKSLLIDVGSTFIKYSICDQDKEIVFFDKIPFPLPIKNDGVNFVVDRKELTDIILGIFEKAKEYKPVVALFSVQMHGYVAKLKDDTFSEYISWRDKSGNAQDAKFIGVNFNRFGLTLKNNLPVTKIDGNSVKEFYTLGSYISFILTGVNATHLTDAFASGFYLSPSGEPNQFAKDMIMPKVYKSVQAIGEYNGIKMVCPFGDHQVSYLGSGAKKESYFVNIGTGAQACCLDTFDYPDADYQKRPYFDDTCLYSFVGLTGIDGKSRDPKDMANRILDALEKLPKKDYLIVGGGGSDEIFDLIKDTLKEKGVVCKKAAFNVGAEGLKILAQEYFSKI